MLPKPFDALPPDFLIEKSISENDIVFRLGDRSGGIFYLLEGEVQLSRYTDSGDAVTIHRAFSGQSFAEASLFSDVYHCDAIAIKDCWLVKIHRQKLLRYFQSDTAFAMEFTAHLAHQVQDYRRILELRAIRRAEDRVYAGIAEGWLQSSILLFAGQLGLSHEATYRALASLTKCGRLVKTGRGKYQVAI